MNGRGRPEKLTDELKQQITFLLKSHKKRLKAPSIQKTLRLYLREVVKKERIWTDKQIDAEAEERLPGISSIQQFVKVTYSRLDKPDKRESIWHMGTLEKYPLSAEAIPYILSIQKWADNLKNLQQEQSSGQSIEGEYNETWLRFNRFDISIRQAEWIARLYSMEDWDKAKKDEKSLNHALYWLWTWSKVYTIEGMISWLSGTDLDTSNIDKALCEDWNPSIMGYGYVLHPKDENIPGIFRTFADSYSIDESLDDVVKNQRAVKNERTHRTTE
jgi:hypothetical protein